MKTRLWAGKPGKRPSRKGLINHVAAAPLFAIVPPVSAHSFKGAFMADDSHYQPGSMDISAHKKGYQGFLTGSKWTFLLVLGIMIFLAIFRTH
jgi:Bacterial aa3 type cytochrome c oxidase subunit IV